MNILNHISSACCSYAVRLPDGSFYAEGSRPSGWFHVVVNFIGVEDGEGVRVYYNGEKVGSDPSKSKYAIKKGNGRIAIGRYFTQNSWRDGSVDVDELVLFSQALTSGEIERLNSK